MNKQALEQALKNNLTDGLALKIEIKDGYLSVTNVGLEDTTYYQVMLLIAAASDSVAKSLDDQAKEISEFIFNNTKH